MRKLAFLIASALCWETILAQDTNLPVFITDSLENYITRGMTEWQIPGLSVAIVKDGEVVFIKGFGVTRAGTKEPVNENTLFMIGANTKTFTATAIAILHEKGLLNLTDKVQKWMPEFKLKDPFASKEMNISDLLSHRTGFETLQDNFIFWKSNLSRAEIIKKMGLMDAHHGLRTEWGYSNAAFVTAGELIPRVTGKSWEKTVKEKILLPLKMDRTLMLSEEFIKASNIAFPHTLVDDTIITLPFDSIDNIAPAGSMSSSAGDMAIWLQAQLDNGTINGIKVISDKAILDTRKPYSIIGLDTKDNQKTHFLLYGLGLNINDCDEKMVYSHAGGVDGFLSYVMFVPEESLGIVVLTNSDQHMFFKNLTEVIRDAFLHLAYQDYSAQSLYLFKNEKIRSRDKINVLKNIVKSNNRKRIPSETFTGTYMNELYGDIEIKSENTNLIIHFSHHPRLTGLLEFMKNYSWLCTFSDPNMGIVEVPFKIDKGKVTGLTLRVSDAVDPSIYEFVKK